MSAAIPELTLAKNSIGVGDRFAHQAPAQLAACRRAEELGVTVVPVWNKSDREHKIVGSEPASVRAAADAAIAAAGWKHPYHVDADHVNLDTVNRFIAPCDFFTLDVADAIGRPPEPGAVERFVGRHAELTKSVDVPGIARPLAGSVEAVSAAASKYLFATGRAAAAYRHIAERKSGPFIAEVSMDETDSPQTPFELLVILAALADEGVPAQTIAPKFSGRFNKGVDYVGNVEQFEEEFDADVAVAAFAISRYGLAASLKLSVHSGSDKFSIYAPMRRALARHAAGVHLKTAGTTWLEELIGLAESGAEGLALAKEVYSKAYGKQADLCAPYATVIDIDAQKLPAPGVVEGWSSEEYAGALRHDQSNPLFNPHLRQLLHVGYKVAAQMGNRYTDMLRASETAISRNVKANLFERHIRPLFLGNAV